MKLPNGYGSVIKLRGKRRKPWAVRISYLEEQPDGTVKRKRKYLYYATDQKHALSYLAEYNNGATLPEHQKYTDVPTFAELYEKWKKYRNSLKSAPSSATWRSYNIAFGMYSPVHNKKIITMRTLDLQDCVSAQSCKSKSTIGNMRAIVRGMWDYALMNNLVESDITQRIVFDFTENTTPIHTRFSNKEIVALWDSLHILNNVDIILIYIYTGCRPAELLEIRRENVHLDKHYMIGGMKTEAGKNRIIPLHDAILPLVENRLNQNRPYLITNKNGDHYTRAVYHNSNFSPLMCRMNFDHSPHDCRYTFASLADSVDMNETCKKIIMGHALANKDGSAFKTGGNTDVTRDVYTEKTIEQLVQAVNLLPTKFDV